MSLDFDGVDDEVVLGSLNTTDTLTLAAWMKADSMGEANVGTLCLHTNRSGVQWNGSAGSNKLRITAGWSGGTAAWDSSSAVSSPTAWHHVAITYDYGSTSNDPTLYLEGAPAAITEIAAPSGTKNADGQGFRAGNVSGGTSTFDGRLAEVAVWSRILSAAEVAAIYLQGVLAVPTGLLVYWPMWGHVANGTDFSGNGRHGTVTGAVAAENPPAPMGRVGHLIGVG